MFGPLQTGVRKQPAPRLWPACKVISRLTPFSPDVLSVGGDYVLILTPALLPTERKDIRNLAARRSLIGLHALSGLFWRRRDCSCGAHLRGRMRRYLSSTSWRSLLLREEEVQLVLAPPVSKPKLDRAGTLKHL